MLPGFLTWLVAWLALQASLVAAQLVNGQTIVWHTRWTMLGAGGALGGALAQALGHALAEDTAFRGFYLPELRARFARLGSGATLLALVGAALLFGLAHLPTRYFVKGSSGMDLLGEQWGFFSAGLALGVACLATRNLFAVVALHVLWNDPAPWLQVPGPLLHDAKICVCAGVIVLAWFGNRRQGSPLESRGPDFAPPPGPALPSSVSRGSAGPNPQPLAGRPATTAEPVAPAAPAPAAPKTPAAPAAPAAQVRNKK